MYSCDLRVALSGALRDTRNKFCYGWLLQPHALKHPQHMQIPPLKKKKKKKKSCLAQDKDKEHWNGNMEKCIEGRKLRTRI